MLKVCIFGGGAIGGHIAGHLARAGLCEVSLVARGKNLQAIQKNGLRVITPENDFTVQVKACEKTNALGVQDYVFLTVKSHQLEAALEQISPLIGPHTTIIPPTTAIPYYFFHRWPGSLNDRQLPLLDPDGKQWQSLPPSQVVGCVYWIGAHLVEPGVVAQDGAKAGCPIGELDGSHSPRVLALSELLTRSGITSRVNDNIRSAIWVKFVNSLCWNPVAVLTLATLGQMQDAGGVVSIVTALMGEVDAIAERIGLVVSPGPEKRIAMTLSAGEHKMSMLQDLEAGRPLELSALKQSLHAIRELTDQQTPLLDSVLALASLRAQKVSHSSTL
ncbi:ketopantoate reductase family protein [Pseudomonas sp. G5(2012)]|uniref:ketopantoate reductase family protein n=1 Tax=Pseudomonas sp. G5(2012) TaxID=1268068 RepID=UPI0003431169|nr:2-dehydropantoate 2-reductase [Pseudomonas sp. G5(2012)]EPA99394.1 2-dehydropantoate 2-reductase [Pseudomonas sp. G5(2012)]